MIAKLLWVLNLVRIPKALLADDSRPLCILLAANQGRELRIVGFASGWYNATQTEHILKCHGLGNAANEEQQWFRESPVRN